MSSGESHSTLGANFTLVQPSPPDSGFESPLLMAEVERGGGVNPGNSELLYRTNFASVDAVVLRALNRIYLQLSVDGSDARITWQITGFETGCERVTIGEWVVDVEYTRGSISLHCFPRRSIATALRKVLRSPPRCYLSAEIFQNPRAKTLVINDSTLARPYTVRL
jgi:hypothetical protein